MAYLCKIKNVSNNGFTNFVCILCLLASGCVKTGYRDNQKKLVNFLTKKDYKSAKRLVDDKDFLPEKDNILLKNIEQGNANLFNNNACVAVEYYKNALEILKNQQTKSIKDEIVKTAVDIDGIYYGQTYEKSLLNFYNSLANYQVYQNGFCQSDLPKNASNNQKYSNNKSGKSDNKKDNGKLSEKEKKNFLNASKANVVYWDSWIKGRTLQDDDKIYVDDLLLKLWGAFVHEESGTNFDIQTAKQLYKDAELLARNRYVVYKSFNRNNRDFIKLLQDKKERENKVDKNNHYVNELTKYVKKQLDRLNKNKKANLSILISDGNVSLKTAKEKISPIGVVSALLDGGKMGIVSILNLKNLTYEVPSMIDETIDYGYYYILSQNGRKVLEQPLVLAEPVSNIAYENLQEKLPGIEAKTLGKVSAQTAIALGASYASYIGLKEVDGFLATVSALSVFAGYSVIIHNAGTTDTRQWVSLPSNIFMSVDHVSKGKYELAIVRRKNALNNDVKDGIVDTKQEELVYKQNIEIGDKTTFLNIFA